MRLISLLPLAAVFAVGNANPMGRRVMVVHESVTAVPSGFAHAGTVSPSKEITLRIALVQSNIAGLQQMTYAVSDPTNALYGQHLTPQEVAEYVKPTAESLSAVSEWLSEHELTAKSISPAGDLLQISLPVSKANELFSTQFASFKHVESGKTSIRTLAYSVPASLQAHIQFVHPTVAFVPPLSGVPGVTAINHKREPVQEESRATPSADAVPTSCASVINPTCLEAMYGIPAAKATSSASNVLAVAGYLDQFANSADLNSFLVNLRRDLVGSAFTLDTIDDGTNGQILSQAGIEADLDIEYTVGIAAGVPVTFISVGSDSVDDVDGFIDIVNSILADPAGITVLTTSYGFNEEDLPIDLAVGMCNAYMQLGAIGISVLFASGDGGVGGVQTTTCTTFVPTAPGGCPFITSVGGSTFTSTGTTAASLSGGGFSNFFPTPDYQAGDVAAYIASIGDLYDGLYNASGRGLPDIAAQAENVEIAWMGSFWLVGGTSCASPIFASMIALINDRLVAAGKPVLGFLNPFLYSPAGRAAFTDLTTGNNPGCDTDGFFASAGWDPVTGLGTPNFALLLTAVGL